MELFFGLVKIDRDFLSSYPLFAISLLVIVVIFLFILTLGRPLLRFFDFLKKAYLSVPRIRRKEDWVADCRERRGWLQKGDAMALKLEGKHLRELTFVAEPEDNPSNWRGGFMIGNPTFSPASIVDIQNAITCHVGVPPILDEAVPVWIFDESHERNNPYSTLVKSTGERAVRFLIKVNEDNFLTIEVQGQIVYAKKVDSSMRKKVYLLAWGDEADCRVRFSGTTYYI